MITLHVCPLFAGEARVLLEQRGRADVRVVPLQGGPDAERCTADPQALAQDTLHCLLAGPCADLKDAHNRFTARRIWHDCFDAVLNPAAIAKTISDGGHLLAPQQLRLGEATMQSWGFGDPESLASYLRESVAGFTLVDLGDEEVRQGAEDLAERLQISLEIIPGDREKLRLWGDAVIADCEKAPTLQRWRTRVAN